MFLDLFKLHGSLVLQNEENSSHLWVGKQSKLKAEWIVWNTNPEAGKRRKSEHRHLPTWNRGSLKLCICFWLWASIQLNIQIPGVGERKDHSSSAPQSFGVKKKKKDECSYELCSSSDQWSHPSFPIILLPPFLIAPFVHFYELKHAHTLAHTGNPAH